MRTSRNNIIPSFAVSYQYDIMLVGYDGSGTFIRLVEK